MSSLLKQKSGDLKGHVLKITDCENVTIVLMDYISQLSIDGCRSVKMFIPACEGSIIVKKCNDCVLYSCCQRLILKECSNSSFFTFSTSEIQIEFSSKCRFGPFCGGYFEHTKHLKKAGLNPTASSLWFQIFDGCNTEYHKKRWELISENEYQTAAWFPDGIEVQAVTVKSASSHEVYRSQIGTVYSALKASSVTLNTEIQGEKATFPIETALMIESAITKRMNVISMLSGGSNNDKTKIVEFERYLKFLATVVGSGKDKETLNDLSKATSPAALKAIENLCGEESTICLSKFLHLCKIEVDKYVNTLDLRNGAAIQHQTSQFLSQDEFSMTIPSLLHDKEVALDVGESDTDIVLGKCWSPFMEEKDILHVNSLKHGYEISRNDLILRIQSAQKNVIDKVTELVKKTDLYHVLQVNLGFLEAYNQFPPRSTIIRYEPKLWISLDELQSAFLKARLRLSDLHIRAFVKSFREFSSSSNDRIVNFLGSSSTNKMPVFHAMRVNTSWLKKYLTFLRLPNSESFETWKKKNKLDIRAKHDCRPMEFKRALSGHEHNLRHEDIVKLICDYNILPDNFLKEEVARRVKCYMLDTNGRREMRSDCNVELKKWQVEHKKVSPWEKLSTDEKNQIKSEIKANLIARKEEEIRKSEKIFEFGDTGKWQGAAISTDIFWKYDDYCKKSRKQAKSSETFGEWIQKYGASFDNRLHKISDDFRKRCFVANLRTERKQSVAAMNELEREVRASIDNSTSLYNKLELHKSLERLKKNVSDAKILGLSDGTTVSKEQFDQEFKNVIAPIMRTFQDNSSIKLLAYEARNCHDGLNLSKNDELNGENKLTFCRTKELFVTPEEATQRAVEIESENMQRCRENFNRWLTKKNMLKAQTKAIAMERASKANEEKRIKQAAGQKAYRKWLKLRRKNYYKSKMENVIKSVPNIKRADHLNKGWNKDIDLADYYGSTENIFCD